MNNNKLNATSLYNDLINIQYCDTKRDVQQEQDTLAVFNDNGFETVKIAPMYKTKEQKQLFQAGRGTLTKFARKYHEGLYICHHPFGKNRFPDFMILIDGKPLEFEVKSASTAQPIFTHGDTIIDPSRRDVVYLFTHIEQGSALMLAEDLISPLNYLLLKRQKKERNELQEKHDAEFEHICGGRGEKVYHRTNVSPRGGSEYTNHIKRAREQGLQERVFHVLKSYE
jgi:regulator of replication initiation timing